MVVTQGLLNASILLTSILLNRAAALNLSPFSHSDFTT